MTVNAYRKIHNLEQKVRQLIETLQQLSEQNHQLKTELDSIRKKKDENMDSVNREIIRTKVQTMLNTLEDI